jgi:hypothetical protein
MGLYEAVKDVAKLAQQADNIDLYRRLLDLSAQALDMQDEISKLKEENARLKRKQDLSSSIKRHKEAFVTIEGEEPMLRYCAHCWDADEKLVQLLCDEDTGSFECPHCKVQGVFDKAKNDAMYRQINSAYVL